MKIAGRDLTVHPLLSEVPLAIYEKTATVLAGQAVEPGEIDTPEGIMRFEAGDYVVTDNPPTHAWPVKRAVFEATYRRRPRP